MEDLLRRLGSVETDMGDLLKRMGSVETDLSGIKAQIPHLATRSDVSDLKASIIQWAVGTTIAAAALVFAIAKFVH